jgi:hypothetical protein
MDGGKSRNFQDSPSPDRHLNPYLNPMFDIPKFSRIPNRYTAKLRYYAGVARLNEEARYWQPAVFREILRDTIFLDADFFLFIIN